jgi:hypothetical protein
MEEEGKELEIPEAEGLDEDMESVPRGTFVALGETEKELKETKAQLAQANAVISKTKSLLLDISKAALQMV